MELAADAPLLAERENVGMHGPLRPRHARLEALALAQRVVERGGEASSRSGRDELLRGEAAELLSLAELTGAGAVTRREGD